MFERAYHPTSKAPDATREMLVGGVCYEVLSVGTTITGKRSYYVLQHPDTSHRRVGMWFTDEQRWSVEP